MVLGKQRHMATQLRDGKYPLPLWPVRRSLDVAHHQIAAVQEEEPSTRTGARRRVCPCRWATRWTLLRELDYNNSNLAVRQNDSEQQLELGNNVSVTFLFKIFLESIMFDVLEEHDGQAIMAANLSMTLTLLLRKNMNLKA